jgi:hypothetical protein
VLYVTSTEIEIVLKKQLLHGQLEKAELAISVQSAKNFFDMILDGDISDLLMTTQLCRHLVRR